MSGTPLLQPDKSTDEKAEDDFDWKMLNHTNVHMALAAAQHEIKNPEKTIPVKFSGRDYKYADLATVLTTVLPVLSRHGLSVSQSTDVNAGQLLLRTVISHCLEGEIAGIYPVCSINNNHQQMGAAMTYARRYALCSMVGVCGEDDKSDGADAAKASGGTPMSTHRAKVEINWPEIEKAIRDAKTERALNNMAARVKDNEGHWPPSYVQSAYDEIDARRREMEAAAAEEWENKSESEKAAMDTK